MRPLFQRCFCLFWLDIFMTSDKFKVQGYSIEGFYDRVPVRPVKLKVVARVLILVGSSYWYMGTVYCSVEVRKPAVIKPSI